MWMIDPTVMRFHTNFLNARSILRISLEEDTKTGVTNLQPQITSKVKSIVESNGPKHSEDNPLNLILLNGDCYHSKNAVLIR